MPDLTYRRIYLRIDIGRQNFRRRRFSDEDFFLKQFWAQKELIQGGEVPKSDTDYLTQNENILFRTSISSAQEDGVL